ncbi:hypothetical protein A2U01_0101669, partial [Trifolium medium]|nr:hypothetical protein [Trifolium medium]
MVEKPPRGLELLPFPIGRAPQPAEL